MSGWPFKNFRVDEIWCPCCHNLVMSYDAMHTLQAMRELLAQPIIVNSGYRCERHNRFVNGAEHSAHRWGGAFDLSTVHRDTGEMIRAAEYAGFTGIGEYDTYIHVDIGQARRWWG